MSSTITETAQTIHVKSESQALKVDGTDPSYGDWRDDLARDGYAVIKGAIPRERADKYADAMFSWLEGFNLGFDRNDLSTVHKDKLPHITEKGMCLQYAVTHEDFAWAMRGEPGVVGAFEKVYDTEDLIVSFDAINFSFPNRKDIPENKPWPHQDQDPLKSGFRCLQGLVNVLPNGPKDGGLIVCKGGHLASTEFHRVFADEPRIPAWTPEWFGFTPAGMEWLDQQGYRWEKVCAEPGDLLVWDSRTPHYNLPSESTSPRFAVYTCYMPVEVATQEDLVRKKEALEKWAGTTHWPNARHVGGNIAMRDGVEDPHNRPEPVNKPVFDQRTWKLTGVPYIKA
ncbi:unnamed protein product [Zymoseptoria tritici ST99CH_1A5]|uniref:Phytanoyl-CoA dioxygenase n=4 Tax=Zymoseptoria tritici TaxID=1047171 RepID=F9XE32_ZYMTI|nr:uncharacterized protein MYCGRDRAFT_100386 [Zymoseptoria tritici IPO323]SMQ51384.1 unnamed protein product [Zymoseptoria tritici ST99CH_3D7]SMR53398.1 unnamed protein product [Zymoseptoria tritici ST99CH_1E4]SMR55837.1 unnamed protein product [Zymoseptoria tritici ST99CH_3D1]SMY25024.1 unnamed protein product [Zymoseptoria tritici ST99CH_1A5]EGP86980.1 hypothetical protein MYCGRDRAFT_100386 [Zymoseptoria tritici IPO323]